MNQIGHESGNPSVTTGRTIPWLQDVDANSDNVSDNWLTSWPYTYRDIVLVNATGNYVGRYNLTINDLGVAENYATLRQIVIDAAEGHPGGTGWTNQLDALDVNHDTYVSPIDALFVLNELNGPFGSHELQPRESMAGTINYLDTNGDGFVAPIDALLVINELNRSSGTPSGPSGPAAAVAAEGEAPVVLDASAIAAALDELSQRKAVDE